MGVAPAQQEKQLSATWKAAENQVGVRNCSRILAFHVPLDA